MSLPKPLLENKDKDLFDVQIFLEKLPIGETRCWHLFYN